MTLPSSGPLTIGDIKGEFGGNASPLLQDYYAGGSFVASGTTSPISGPVPSSGPISIESFYGTSAALAAYSVVVGNFAGVEFGWSAAASFGAINPSSAWTVYTPDGGPVAVSGIFWISTDNSFWVTFTDEFLDYPNSTWTSITVNGHTFTRASASYSGGDGNGNPGATWKWTTSNPVGTSGTIGVTFV